LTAREMILLVFAVGILLGVVLYTILMKKLTIKLYELEKTTEKEKVVGKFTNHFLYKLSAEVVRILVVLGWLAATYQLMGMFEPLKHLRNILAQVIDMVYRSAVIGVFYRPLFPIGEQQVTLAFMFNLVVIVVIVVIATGFARNFIKRNVLARFGLKTGPREAVATVVGYVIMAVGLLVAFEIAGLDLSTLAVIAGALSIGLGFGLQNIANNFVSGLILLIERPVKVGDRIEVGETHGKVMGISARSTTVRTNENIDIIVPNSELISARVINWSQKDRKIRFTVPVGVAYGTDVRKAMKLMTEAAESVSGVDSASARFTEFGDSALELEARIWTTTLLDRPAYVRSDVNVAILEKFVEHDIEIPFPQRDIHIK